MLRAKRIIDKPSIENANYLAKERIAYYAEIADYCRTDPKRKERLQNQLWAVLSHQMIAMAIGMAASP